MSVRELTDNLPQVGTVKSILIRKEKYQSPVSVNSVVASQQMGLDGDHYSANVSATASTLRSTKRQVTLIQYEHILAIASLLGVDTVDAGLLRRNIVVSGINLLAFKDKNFSIGNTHLIMTGLCQPCSRMERALGPGGFNAMRGHGGITAKIILDGEIKINDLV